MVLELKCLLEKHCDVCYILLQWSKNEYQASSFCCGHGRLRGKGWIEE